MAKRIIDREKSLKLLDSSLRAIGKKHDIKVFGLRILVLNGKDVKAPKQNDVGIRVWGMVDGLCKYQGYRQHFVDNFNKKK